MNKGIIQRDNYLAEKEDKDGGDNALMKMVMLVTMTMKLMIIMKMMMMIMMMSMK